MSSYNLQVLGDKGSETRTITVPVKASAVAVNIGEPVAIDGSHAGYFVSACAATSSKLDSTIAGLIGVAASAGTHTASVDGLVDVTIPVGTTMTCRMTALAAASLAATQYGLNRAIDISSLGVATFDQSTSTNGIAKLRRNQDGSIDTTNGVVEVDVRFNYWTA
jgi:hypothetical protein